VQQWTEPAFAAASADRVAHGARRSGRPDRPQLPSTGPLDELSLRRLKKRRLLLRDQIARLQDELDPPEPA
jgi:hypothetical protein